MAEATLTAAKWGLVFYGPSPTVTINLSAAGATSYVITDIYGNTWTGSVSVGATSFTPTAPGGGWINGSYTVALAGPSSYWAIGAFHVLNADSRFPTAPAHGVATAPAGSDMYFYGDDFVGYGVSQIGMYRFPILNVISDGTAQIAAAKNILTFMQSWTSTDVVRQPEFVCAVSANTYAIDSCTIGSIRFCRRGGHTDAASLTIGAGTNPGTYKLTITDTSTSTVVETHDNCVNELAIQAACNAQSNGWVYAWEGHASAPTSGTAALASTNTLATMAVVSALYNYNSSGCTWFNGPVNEPSIGPGDPAGAAAFQSVVHAAASGAKALVPSFAAPTQGGPMAAWVVAMQTIGVTPDGVDFHPYNIVDSGDLAAMDLAMPTVMEPIQTAFPSATIMCTEFGMFSGEYATYSPYGIARILILALLFCESWGIPKEAFYWFYCNSRGFSFTSWWKNGDATLTPVWMAGRGISERLAGTTFSQRLTLPAPLDRMFLAEQWTGNSQLTTVIVNVGMPTATVKLNVTGASSLTVYDWAGNSSTVAVSGGHATVTTSGLGTWIVVPNTATVAIADINAGLMSLGPNLADPDVTGAVFATSSTVAADTGGGSDHPGLGWLNGSDPGTADRTNIGQSPWTDSSHAIPSTLTVTPAPAILPAPRPNPSFLFGTGDEISGALASPLFNSAPVNMISSWVNNVSDMQTWAKSSGTGVAASGVNAEGLLNLLIVFMHDYPIYAITSQFQTDLAAVINQFKGTATLPLYVVLFTEVSTYTSGKCYTPPISSLTYNNTTHQASVTFPSTGTGWDNGIPTAVAGDNFYFSSTPNGVTGLPSGTAYPVVSSTKSGGFTTIVVDITGHTAGGAFNATTLSSALSFGNTYTSVLVPSLPQTVHAGDTLVINPGGVPSQTVTVATSVAATGSPATVPVNSFVANTTYAVGTPVIDGPTNPCQMDNSSAQVNLGYATPADYFAALSTVFLISRATIQAAYPGAKVGLGLAGSDVTSATTASWVTGSGTFSTAIAGGDFACFQMMHDWRYEALNRAVPGTSSVNMEQATTWAIGQLAPYGLPIMISHSKIYDNVTKFQLGTALTGGVAVTSVTTGATGSTTLPQNVVAGDKISIGGQVVTVASPGATMSTGTAVTIPITSFTPAATIASGSTMEVIGARMSETASLSAVLNSGTLYTSILVSALPGGVVAGDTLVINPGGSNTQTITVATTTAAGATSIPTLSFRANATYATGTSVQDSYHPSAAWANYLATEFSSANLATFAGQGLFAMNFMNDVNVDSGPGLIAAVNLIETFGADYYVAPQSPPVLADRVIVLCPPPVSDGQRNSITQLQIQALVSGVWTTVYSETNPTATTTAFPGSWSVGGGGPWSRLSSWDAKHQFDCSFTPVLASAFRAIAQATSMGQVPDAAAASADAGRGGDGGITQVQYLQCRLLGVYCVSAQTSTSYLV